MIPSFQQFHGSEGKGAALEPTLPPKVLLSGAYFMGCRGVHAMATQCKYGNSRPSISLLTLCPAEGWQTVWSG
jgi:hypothetical protein